MSKQLWSFPLPFLAYAVLLSPLAQAALVEYTYTGSVFDAETGTAYELGVDHISGSFIIDDADMVSVGALNTLASVTGDIVSFSFDDGSSGAPFSSTISDATAVSPTGFAFYTDADGNILQWDIFVAEDASDRWMSWCNTVNGCTGSGQNTRDVVINRDLPNFNNTASTDTVGIWSGPTVIPLPPAVTLFISALGLLGWMRRKAA